MKKHWLAMAMVMAVALLTFIPAASSAADADLDPAIVAALVGTWEGPEWSVIREGPSGATGKLVVRNVVSHEMVHSWNRGATLWWDGAAGGPVWRYSRERLRPELVWEDDFSRFFFVLQPNGEWEGWQESKDGETSTVLYKAGLVI